MSSCPSSSCNVSKYGNFERVENICVCRGSNWKVLEIVCCEVPISHQALIISVQVTQMAVSYGATIAQLFGVHPVAQIVGTIGRLSAKLPQLHRLLYHGYLSFRFQCTKCPQSAGNETPFECTKNYTFESKGKKSYGYGTFQQCGSKQILDLRHLNISREQVKQFIKTNSITKFSLTDYNSIHWSRDLYTAFQTHFKVSSFPPLSLKICVEKIVSSPFESQQEIINICHMILEHELLKDSAECKELTAESVKKLLTEALKASEST